MFQVGRDVYLEGRAAAAASSSASRTRSSRSARRSTRAKRRPRLPWLSSAARRSSSLSGSLVYAASPARCGVRTSGSPARRSRRRTRCSPPSAPTLVASVVLCVARSSRHDFSLRLRRRPHEPRAADSATRCSAFWGGQEGSLLLWLLVLTGVLGRAPSPDRPPRRARAPRLGRAGARRRRDLLRLPARRRREPVRDADRGRRRRRARSRACRTRTCSRTRRCSTSATSG